MKNYQLFKNHKKIHFIGIGGVGMSALAKHLKSEDFDVSGSDLCANNIKSLKAMGIKLFNNHSKENVKDAQIVVYNSAIPLDNVEIRQAQEQKAVLIKRSQLLGEIFSQFNTSIAVSGSHGKTTTTAMLSNILIDANLEPTVFLGGEDKSYGNYRKGKGKVIIAEACEYKKNFLDLFPKISVILNIDNDHMDCYKDINEIIQAFYEFSKNSVLIINSDNEYSKEIFNNKTITFGIKTSSTIMAKQIKKNSKGYSFTAYAFGKKLGRINLNIDGMHNVYNAMASIAVSEYLKIPFSVQKKALGRFNGVKRRNEFLGRAYNMDIYADYAHHPNEIKAMIKTYEKYNDNIVYVFQPHTYSRTKILMDDFVSCLSSCKALVILKTYPAREKYCKKGSAKTLFETLHKNNQNVFYAQNKKDIESIFKELNFQAEKAIFLGAGDIYEIATAIANKDK